MTVFPGAYNYLDRRSPLISLPFVKHHSGGLTQISAEERGSSSPFNFRHAREVFFAQLYLFSVCSVTLQRWFFSELN